MTDPNLPVRVIITPVQGPRMEFVAEPLEAVNFANEFLYRSPARTVVESLVHIKGVFFVDLATIQSVQVDSTGALAAHEFLHRVKITPRV